MKGSAEWMQCNVTFIPAIANPVGAKLWIKEKISGLVSKEPSFPLSGSSRRLFDGSLWKDATAVTCVNLKGLLGFDKAAVQGNKWIKNVYFYFTYLLRSLLDFNLKVEIMQVDVKIYVY